MWMRAKRKNQCEFNTAKKKDTNLPAQLNRTKKEKEKKIERL